MKTLLTTHLFHALPDEIMDKGRSNKGTSIKTISTFLMQGFFPNKKDSLFFLMQVRKVPVQRWVGDSKQGAAVLYGITAGCSLHLLLPYCLLGCCLHLWLKLAKGHHPHLSLKERKRKTVQEKETVPKLYTSFLLRFHLKEYIVLATFRCE